MNNSDGMWERWAAHDEEERARQKQQNEYMLARAYYLEARGGRIWPRASGRGLANATDKFLPLVEAHGTEEDKTMLATDRGMLVTNAYDTSKKMYTEIKHMDPRPREMFINALAAYIVMAHSQGKKEDVAALVKELQAIENYKEALSEDFAQPVGLIVYLTTMNETMDSITSAVERLS